MHVFELSADTILCCAALAPARLPSRTAWRLAAGFGACEAATSALAPSLGLPMPGLATFAIYLACAGLLGAAALRSRVPLWLLPVLLSLDNLVDAQQDGSAMLAGLASAAAAFVTLKLCARALSSLHAAAAPKRAATI